MGLIKKLGKIVRAPLADIADTAAGAFRDVTQPFLGPIDDILDVFSPRLRIKGELSGGVTATVAGGTRHELVLPQLPWGSATSSSAAVAAAGNDITGGLLSDLAFRSEELRKAEDTLHFLDKAMRKGLYPHRDDSMLLRLRLVPEVQMKSDVVAIVQVRGDDGNLDQEMTLPVRKAELDRSVGAYRRRIGATAANAPFDDTDLDDEIGVSAELALPIAWPSGVPLLVKVTFLNATGVETPALAGQFAALELTVERYNQGFADVLHRLHVTRPVGEVEVPFYVDRHDYYADWVAPECRLEALPRAGGSFQAAAAELARAGDLIGTFSRLGPTQAGAGATTGGAASAASDRVASSAEQYLLSRVQAAQSIREALWSARRNVAAIRMGNGMFDYRLRYKLVLENLRSDDGGQHSVNSVEFENVNSATNGRVRAWKLGSFQLPARSVWEHTVYPTKITEYDKASAVVDAEHPGAQGQLLLSLLAGIGGAQAQVLGRRLESHAGKPARQLLAWQVRDACSG